MKRHHTGLRRERSRVRRRTDAELDVTRFDELKNLRLLAELGTRILIDQNRTATQFLELVGEKIARDAIPGGLWLVIGKAIMLCLLRHAVVIQTLVRIPSVIWHIALLIAGISPSPSGLFCALPMCNTHWRRPTMVIVSCSTPIYGIRPAARLTRKPMPLLA